MHPGLTDRASDSASEVEAKGTLEVSDTEGSGEDEESFVMNPYLQARSLKSRAASTSKVSEPTRREIKVRSSRGARSMHRASSVSSTTMRDIAEAVEEDSPLDGPSRISVVRTSQSWRESIDVDGGARANVGASYYESRVGSQSWRQFDRAQTVSSSSLKFGELERKRPSAIMDLDDPFVSVQQPRAGPLVPLASGPRFQGNGTRLEKKRSLDVFLDDSDPNQRAYGEKRRIRAVPPRR
jgi:hypothetical protein